jgi:DNA-binding response OmpR family regulator
MNDVVGLRLLVVEDEMLIAMTIEDVLTDMGCVVVGPASSVAKAMDLLKGEEVDGAILDLNLKGEQAIPVAEALQKQGTPFFFLTGYGSTGTSQTMLDAPTLPKPFDPTALQQLIEETIAPHRKART